MGDETKNKPMDDAEYGKILSELNGPQAKTREAQMAEMEQSRLLGGGKEGLDAINAIAEFDARTKESMSGIRRRFGNDVSGFRKFLAYHGAESTARRDALARVVTAEAKHGQQVALKNATEGHIRRITEKDIVEATGATLNQANDSGVAGETMQNGLAGIDGTAEAMRHQLDRERKAELDAAETDEQREEINSRYDAELAVMDFGNTQAKAAVAKTGVDAIQAAFGETKAAADAQVEPYIGSIRKIFLDRYKGHRSLGQSNEIALANALEATRAASISYFKERIARGQYSFVVNMLDTLSRTNDEKFDQSRKNKDTPLGIYDPSNLAFLHHSDIDALRRAAYQQFSQDQQLIRMKSAQTGEMLKIKNAQIRFDADKLARQSVLDMDAMEKLFDRTEELIHAGLPQAAETSSYLRGIVDRAERKFNRAQKDAVKLQTEEDFEREYNTFMRDINGAAPMYFFSQTADGKSLLQFTMDENGKPVHIDGQNRMILLIRNGLSRGIVKGKMWNDRLEQLENGRAMEDRYAAMSALADAGISFDPKGTQNVIDAKGGSFADVNDERGGVSASSWGEDRATHRLRVGSPQMMMYTYKDPVTGRTVPINGTQLNDLLEEVGLWQMRHPNPSPTGGKPAELTEFIRRSLDKAIVRETKKHWFSKDERDVPVGFGDIRSSAHREYEAYFAPRGNIPVYGRDIWGLQGKVLGGELPTTETIRKFLTNPKVWTTKGK